ALPGLQSKGAGPAGPRAMRQFEPQLGAVVVEHGADRVALVFGMGVAGARELQPQGVERAGLVEAGADFLAALVHDDVHVIVRVAMGLVGPGSVAMVVIVVVVPAMGVPGHAVAAVEQAGAGADEAAHA